MRSYLHDIDVDFAAEARREADDRIARLTATIARVVPRKLDIYPRAVRAAADSAIYAWATDEPLAVVAGYWLRARDWIAEALTHPVTVNAFDAAVWITVPLVARDPALFTRTSACVPDQVENWADREEMIRAF
jgi:hypothetical protein